MNESLSAEQQRDVLMAGITNPLLFLTDILGCELDDQQIPIVNVFAEPDTRRVAVKSGHSCGKDYLAARLALWFLVTRPGSIVVITGPTERQVELICWNEVKSAYKQARWPLGGELMETKLKTDDPKHYMVGYTAKDSSSFQGIHPEQSILVIVTEAQGIDPEIFVGIESLLSAPESKLLLIGNALYEPGSEFYSAFTSKRHIYKNFTMDSRKSSHCNPQLIQEWLDTYGEDSPVYMARVKGEFPEDVADTLIPLSWIVRAQERYGLPVEDVSLRTMGTDVARFGSDETVQYVGEGIRFRCTQIKQGQDLMQTVGWIIQDAAKYNIPWPNVRVDDTGLGGGVTDRLREQKYNVTAINFASGPSDPNRVSGPANARSELFTYLRERFRLGTIAIDPKDTKLLRDLSVLKYKVTSNKGQIRLLDKAELKRVLGYSPDRADALALAAFGQAEAETIASGNRTNLGLLEFMRRQAEKSKAKNTRLVAASRPAVEIPGAAEALKQEGAR